MKQMIISLLNPLELAYIGDSVYELFVRQYNINKNIRKVNNLQKETVKYVNAYYQAKAIKYLIDNKYLTDIEIEIFKTSRNYKNKSRAKHADIITYKHATGFEALIGYLYLDKQYDRLNKLLNILMEGCKC